MDAGWDRVVCGSRARVGVTARPLSEIEFRLFLGGFMARGGETNLVYILSPGVPTLGDRSVGLGDGRGRFPPNVLKRWWSHISPESSKTAF